jgi:hypothetical protein
MNTADRSEEYDQIKDRIIAIDLEIEEKRSAGLKWSSNDRVWFPWTR